MTLLCCFGVSFRNAPIAVRERLAWSSATRRAIACACVAAEGIREALVIVTCNRAELYTVVENGEDARTTTQSALAGIDRSAAEVIGSVGYCLTDMTAMHHLFRVAASLDAMVVGEPQVLGQVKAAYQEAQAAGTVGKVLHRVMQRCFTAAKQIRHETGIGLHPVSVGSVTVELAQQIFGDLAACRLLMVGIGAIGRHTIPHLRAAGVADLWLANRTAATAAETAAAWDATPIPWDQLDRALAHADIVMTAMGATAPVITRTLVESILPQRRRPLFLLDIAMPRNIAPDVGRLPEVYLYDLDDLQTLADQNLATRKAAVERAEGLVTVAAQQCYDCISHTTLAPTIAQLYHKCEVIRAEEMAKTMARHPEGGRTLQEALEACTSAIVSKILHDPVLHVKETKETLFFFKRLFRLDETMG